MKQLGRDINKMYQQTITENIQKAKENWYFIWLRDILFTITMRLHPLKIDWQNVKYPLPNVV